MTTRIYLTLPSYENHEVDMMQVAYRGAVPDGHDYLIRAWRDLCRLASPTSHWKG